jgi:hypothetical protein
VSRYIHIETCISGRGSTTSVYTIAATECIQPYYLGILHTRIHYKFYIYLIAGCRRGSAATNEKLGPCSELNTTDKISVSSLSALNCMCAKWTCMIDYCAVDRRLRGTFLLGCVDLCRAYTLAIYSFLLVILPWLGGMPRVASPEEWRPTYWPD